MSQPQPVPAGHPAIVPHLVVRGAAEAIASRIEKAMKAEPQKIRRVK